MRSETNKPTIGIIIGSSRFTSHLGGNAICTANRPARTKIHHTFHHLRHHIGIRFADHFFALGGEGGQHIAIAVFDAGDEIRLHIKAPASEHRVRSYHFNQGDICRTQCDGWYFRNFRFNTTLLGKINRALYTELIDQKHGTRVFGIGQTDSHRTTTTRDHFVAHVDGTGREGGLWCITIGNTKGV